MKHSIWIAGALLLMLTGCRQESDYVLSYAFNDEMAFNKADSSFVGKFDVFWHGMNTNYAMWDYEKANGLDWDVVYDTFRPQFAALDAVDTMVSDKQLQALLNEVVAPLHDGHLTITMKNHVTGNNVSASPGVLRIRAERQDEYRDVSDFKSSLQYYVTSGEVLEYKQASSNTLITAVGTAVGYLRTQINTLDAKTSRTPEEEQLLALYKKVHNDLAYAVNNKFTTMASAVSAFNEIALRYEYLRIPGLAPVDNTLNANGIDVKYALFKGNIAYLSFDSFKLSAYLDPEIYKEVFGKPSESTQAVINEVVDTWKAWFNAIQAHHKAGDLGGVIIDIRSNGGGNVPDYPFVMGALLPSGGFQVTDARYKRGPGRYDYSPVMPQYMETYKGDHVTVTEPIVVLCNCASVSMAEQTSLSAKRLENGTLIGTRTWGGMCALSGSSTYSDDYSGFVGVQGVTPVYCYIPRQLVISVEGEVLDGKGITPDIEVQFDRARWNGGAGPDSQLDRALQYLHNGN